MNRISGKPLKTRGSGTLVVAGISCLLFDRFENLRHSRQRGCSLLNPPKRAFEPRGQKNEHPIGRFEPSGQRSEPPWSLLEVGSDAFEKIINSRSGGYFQMMP